MKVRSTKVMPKPGTRPWTNDGPASRTFPAIGMPSAPGAQPRHAERPIIIVLDVLLARPQELDRDIDLLGDHHRLADEFLNGGAAAEAPAQERAMDHDLVVRHAGGAGRRCQRGHRLLRRHPDFDTAIG